MASSFPGLFVHPTISFSNRVGFGINTDNDGDGEVTNRLYPFAGIIFIIVLDSLFDKYAEGRSIIDDQADIYRSVEERLETTYGLDGKACVQRFICELTKNPIHDHTMIGELITVVFSPREDGSGTMEEYHHAQLAGEVEHPESCHIAYGNFCPISVYNYFDPDKADYPINNNNLGPQPPQYRSSFEQQKYGHTVYRGHQ